MNINNFWFKCEIKIKLQPHERDEWQVFESNSPTIPMPAPEQKYKHI